MKRKIALVKHFMAHTLWVTPENNLPTLQRWGFQLLKILWLTFYSFKKDEFNTKVSSLTFFSTLSIVPVVAIVFGIANGFGLADFFEAELKKNLAGQEQVIDYLINFSDKMLANAKGGAIAGVSLVFLFWTVMNLLSNIEVAFNRMWDVKKSRSLQRKFTDYVAILVFAPILVFLSSSLSVFVFDTLRDVSQSGSSLEFISPFIVSLLKFLPYVLIWLVFTLLYLIMPNTKVQLKSAIIAGIIAGSAYQFAQWGYINFQVLTSRYSAIYGSFAAVPLFLIWMNISWYIVLVGAEVAYSIQFYNQKTLAKQVEQISFVQRIALSLALLHIVVRNFADAKEPAQLNDLADQSGLPYPVTSEVMAFLEDSGLVASVLTNDGNGGYLPANDISKTDVIFVLEKLTNFNHNNIIEEYRTKNIEEYNLLIKNIFETLRHSNSNKLLKDLNI